MSIFFSTSKEMVCISRVFMYLIVVCFDYSDKKTSVINGNESF